MAKSCRGSMDWMKRFKKLHCFIAFLYYLVLTVLMFFPEGNSPYESEVGQPILSGNTATVNASSKTGAQELFQSYQIMVPFGLLCLVFGDCGMIASWVSMLVSLYFVLITWENRDFTIDPEKRTNNLVFWVSIVFFVLLTLAAIPSLMEYFSMMW